MDPKHAGAHLCTPLQVYWDLGFWGHKTQVSLAHGRVEIEPLRTVGRWNPLTMQLATLVQVPGLGRVRPGGVVTFWLLIPGKRESKQPS